MYRNKLLAARLSNIYVATEPFILVYKTLVGSSFHTVSTFIHIIIIIYIIAFKNIPLFLPPVIFKSPLSFLSFAYI